MSTLPSNPYDAPACVVDAIFGQSVEAGGDGPTPLVAQLDDVEEGLRLTLVRQGRADAPKPKFVIDLAAADREINAFLQCHPDHEVVRIGDGWTAHPQ